MSDAFMASVLDHALRFIIICSVVSALISVAFKFDASSRRLQLARRRASQYRREIIYAGSTVLIFGFMGVATFEAIGRG
ncbi:MAG: hypothetical protein AAGJ87_11590, partial [Pseudomonadota bacterium]